MSTYASLNVSRTILTCVAPTLLSPEPWHLRLALVVFAITGFAWIGIRATQVIEGETVAPYLLLPAWVLGCYLVLLAHQELQGPWAFAALMLAAAPLMVVSAVVLVFSLAPSGHGLSLDLTDARVARGWFDFLTVPILLALPMVGRATLRIPVRGIFLTCAFGGLLADAVGSAWPGLPFPMDVDRLAAFLEAVAFLLLIHGDVRRAAFRRRPEPVPLTEPFD